MRNVAVRGAEARAISPVKVIGSNADVVVGVLDGVVLLLWRRRIVPEGVAWSREAFTHVGGAKQRGKIIFVTTLLPDCNLGTPADVRKDIAALIKSHETQITCAAIVFESAGFGMTIVRSVITAITMASRTRFPNAVFGDVDAAMNWVASHAEDNDIPFARERILEAVGYLRTL
jgi:hypothetical protein